MAGQPFPWRWCLLFGVFPARWSRVGTSVTFCRREGGGGEVTPGPGKDAPLETQGGVGYCDTGIDVWIRCVAVGTYNCTASISEGRV